MKHLSIALAGALFALLGSSASAQTIAQRVTALEKALAEMKNAQLSKGTVVFTQAAACPTGFIELTAMQGRYIVGLPSGGTLNGEVGKPLANMERRNTVAWHQHSIQPDQLAHTHKMNTNRLGYDAGKPGAADGSNLPITEQKDTGPAEFAKGAQGNPILTDAYGLTDQDDRFINAPYIQLLACVKG